MSVDFEVIHSVLECDLCGESDFCVEARRGSWRRMHFCSDCVNQMQKRFDEVDSLFVYTLRREQA